jgi:hypothetical protein
MLVVGSIVVIPDTPIPRRTNYLIRGKSCILESDLERTRQAACSLQRHPCLPVVLLHAEQTETPLCEYPKQEESILLPHVIEQSTVRLAKFALTVEKSTKR